MGYLDIIQYWPEIDQLSASELQSLCSNGDPPPAIHEHLQETRIWWGSTITDIGGDEHLCDPPDTIPGAERLARASERGTFLGDWS